LLLAPFFVLSIAIILIVGVVCTVVFSRFGYFYLLLLFVFFRCRLLLLLLLYVADLPNG
jgi:hypothetical protein